MKDLILLHGALGAASEFDRFLPYLNDHFNCQVFDLPGHGKNTSDVSFSMDLFANELKSFIASNGMDKPQIFGYSMGGYVGYTEHGDQSQP